jgi:hypothetical protein
LKGFLFDTSLERKPLHSAPFNSPRHMRINVLLHRSKAIGNRCATAQLTASQ